MPKIFEGDTVTIVGGGPSLKGFDFERLRQPVIGTNHSMKYHEGELLVAIDRKFHEREKEYLDGLNCFKVTYEDTHREDFIRAELNPDHDNWQTSLDWHIKRANLSGYFAVSVALHLGADKLILLGFDGGYDVNSDTPNFHPHHYQGPGMNFYTENHWYDFYKGFDIVNVGMGSRIRSFKKVPLESDFYG